MAQVEQAVKGNELSVDAKRLYREMGVRDTSTGAVSNMTNDDVYTSSKTLARITLIDIGVFFAVLILGFAYVWKRGDLDWVKAVTEQRRLARLPADE
jgi:preprotein translocase subunit SecG